MKDVRRGRASKGGPMTEVRRRESKAPRSKGGRRSSDVWDAVLEVARELYVTGGYTAVTMREIAARLGIKAPSLYNHFLGKDEIFVALQERAFELQLEAELHAPEIPDPLEDLRQFFWRYYEFSKAHPDYFALAYVDPAAPPLHARVYDLNPLRNLDAMASRKIRRCIDAGVFPKATHEHHALQTLWATMHGPAALRVIRHQHVSDFDLVASQALELALGGLRAGALPAGMERFTQSIEARVQGGRVAELALARRPSRSQARRGWRSQN